MKHIEDSSWINVKASLIAAGVETEVAVGIVAILVKYVHKQRDKYSTPLILSKAQRVEAPRKDIRMMGCVDQIMPRLFLLSKERLAAQDLKCTHDAYHYGRYAVLAAKDLGQG